MTAFFYDCIYMIPISVSALLFLSPFIAIEGRGWIPYALTIFVLLLSRYVKFGKNKIRYFIPVLLPGLCGLVIWLQPMEERLTFCHEYQWVLWCGLIALGSFIAGLLFSRSRWCRRLFVLGNTAGLIVLMLLHAEPPKAAVAGLLFLLIVCLVEEIQEHWKKSGYSGQKGHLVFISPFLLALGILVYVIPAAEKPYDWELFVNMWDRIVEQVKISGRLFRIHDEDYEKAVIGFSDKANFVSDLWSAPEDVMELTPNKDSGEILYLPGKVFDTFDGQNWTQTYRENNRNRMLDTLETICAVRAFDGDYARNYIWQMGLKLRYLDFYTNYMFVPSKSIIKGDSIGEIGFTAKGGDILANEKMGYDTTYNVQYFRLNRDHQALLDLLQNDNQVTEQMWNTICSENRILYKEGFHYEDYVAYHKNIYDWYLSPVNLSGNLRASMEEVLEGTESDIDKLRRIEALLGHFTYTDKPGAMPEEIQSKEEFLDYFMLEKRAGYCSHFATAFVLLARAYGIPARYVQGYQVSLQGGNQPVTISSDMAHAWAEAYIDGVGWIPFEPTPGKYTMSYWPVQKKKDKQESDLTGGEGFVDHSMELPWPEREESREEIPVEEEAADYGIVLYLLAFGLFLLVLYGIADYILVRVRLKKLTTDQKGRVLWKRNRKVLDYLGYMLSETETLEEFYNRLKLQFPKEELEFLLLYERNCYLEQAFTSAGCEIMEQAYTALTARLREQKKRRYFWYKLQLMHEF